MGREESPSMPTAGAPTHEITALLRAWEEGQAAALDDLIPVVYRELKRLARRHMRGRDGETLQTTAVVHEAYLRLVEMRDVRWADRAHFYAVSARIMRGILVDAARARCAQKRGGVSGRAGLLRDIDLDQVPDMGSVRAGEILAIHDALEQLATMDPRQAHVVEMRFFVGLSVDETAAVLKVSPQSVMRDWKLAKAWLRREIRRGTGDSKD
jgi:RNA polymerase sigma factor (TIGR02999 family)